ncbi:MULTISPECIES: hypothetical protein [Haloferax]|jgi:hypothetical protein|uniref:Uncharacterized protein n=3 Tax=Haloferax TaxID=2251 RepID=A0ACD5HVN5_9EURY|nr:MULTISPECIES: hypothetical protein [Haloferax]RDZ30217.1 hypothetical protein DEQ67_16645 [Haloferax sp. Atlit-48N]RDZ36827.1 hypothetical protein C5B88_01645 [Haloferax sp. Atlit-24N]RDZ42958.1 hypothetical protein C5B86_14830 [Haloferax sp. Atlit-19N]RLM37625.1 hypothetical protein DVK03_01645 [Haloferax sp. Atlit-109R]RLM45566.1 hypothetical protein DVK04_01660 [Haloferax sp. Atlit-105R]
MFRKLCDREGTPTVSLDKDELRMDGVLDEDGVVPDDQEMHIQRVGKRSYLVRAVDSDGIPELDEVFQ